jgi:hypothetical protein
MKGLFRGGPFEAGERLLSAVKGIFGSLENWALTKIFLQWMRRLERCIEINGDYVGQAKIKILVVIDPKR